MKHHQIYIAESRNTSILDLVGMSTEKFKLNSQDILMVQEADRERHIKIKELMK